MKEVRKANIICNKTGQGYNTYKISLPNKWVQELNITPENRAVNISLEDNKIVIKKAEE